MPAVAVKTEAAEASTAHPHGGGEGAVSTSGSSVSEPIDQDPYEVMFDPSFVVPGHDDVPDVFPSSRPDPAGSARVMGPSSSVAVAVPVGRARSSRVAGVAQPLVRGAPCEPSPRSESAHAKSRSSIGVRACVVHGGAWRGAW